MAENVAQLAHEEVVSLFTTRRCIFHCIVDGKARA